MNHANLSLVLALLVVLAPGAPAQWVRQTLPAGMGMALDVASSGDSSLLASGYILSDDFHGRAAYTTDGGATWNPSAVPDSSRALVAVEFTSPDSGFIAAAFNQSTFSRAVRVFPEAERAFPADGIHRKLQRIGFDGGASTEGAFTGGMILTTVDGGQSWAVKHVFPDSITYLLGGSFPTSRVGFVTAALLPSSGETAILKTTDGGSSWTALPIPDSITTLMDVCFIDTLRGYAAGRQFRNFAISGVVIRTTDGGATWTRTDFPAVTGLLDLEFPSAATGYAVGTKANSFIYKTTDSGVSWTPLSYQPDTIVLDGVCFAPGGVAGTAYGLKIRNDSLGSPLPSVPVAVRTTDGGTTWVPSFLDTSLANTLMVGGIQPDPLTAFLSGGMAYSDGLMLRTDNGGITAVQGGGGVEIPGRFLLHQNYPNPFNPVTTIVFDLPAETRLTIGVYNQLGERVAVIAAGSYPPGAHAAAWDASSHPSGVYYYRLAAEGFSAMGKMLLMK